MDFTTKLNAHLTRIEAGIDRFLPPAMAAGNAGPRRIHETMRYSMQAGGKRLRPVLVLAAAELSGEKSDALPAAVAIECVHTYSLIHDDLPCMDNDDLRRGRPTAHKKFDEATALLAGDALLTHAFALLAENYPAALVAALVRELASAAGSSRLIGGQMEDLLAEKKADATDAGLEFIHLSKTAAMIEASLALGGFCSGADEAGLAALRAAGRHLGLAFQIIDDILDTTADSATLGKTAGKDAKTGKTTFVKLHGLDASRRLAREHTQAALTALDPLPGDKSFLVALIQNMASRSK
ncbi:MAG TPA: farnesyl diphosphate synthase [Opitutaceae bacterium]|jgi:geranylgeranyl diphosphate synthase type II|nr:farnesyl diphosphate synthase [Opitutaceae bacterium]